MRSKFLRHVYGRPIIRLRDGAFAIGCAAALLACPAHATVPGTPGTPQPATPIFVENFQNAASTTWIRLTAYAPDIPGTGSTPNLPPKPAGESYTADPPWLTACNGMVLSFNSGGATPAECATSGWAYVRQLAQALGQVDGMTQAQARQNLAVTAFTNANVTPNLTQFRTTVDVPFSAPSTRFVTFSVDAAAVSCTSAHPAFQFLISNGIGEPISVGSTLDPCAAGTPTRPVEAIGGNPAQNIRAARFATNASYPFTGASFGVSMRNAQGSGVGNDAAFDNIRVYDATPQLDKAFAPVSVATGQTSVLTLTVTNTSELASKLGFSFTDTLPPGLTVAATPGVTNTCGGTVTASGSTITLATTAPPASGPIPATVTQLASGAASCAVSVNVVTAGPGNYLNGPGNITASVGLNPPATAVLVSGAPAQCGVLWADASGSSAANPPGNVLYRIDPSSGAGAADTSGGPISVASTAGNVSSLAIDPRTGRMFAVDNTTGNLRTLAPGATAWTNATTSAAAVVTLPNGTGGNRYSRAIMDGSGNLYIGSSNFGAGSPGNSRIFRYPVAPDGSVGARTNVDLTFSGGTPPAADAAGGGDFAIAPNGNFYYVLNDPPSGAVQIYLVAPSVATGTTATAALVNAQNLGGSIGSAAFFNGRLYLGAAAGTVFIAGLDPVTNTWPSGAYTALPGTNPAGLIDMASCAGTATVQLAKISNHATGTFGYTGVTNLAGITTDSITTTTPGVTALSGQVGLVATLGAAVTATETVPAGYVLDGATCTDANSASTGNPASFGGITSGSTLTIPAANVKAGAAITCTFTNTALPDLSITKTDGSATYTPGGAISYTIVAGNTGPATVVGAIVADTIPPAIQGATWTCVGAGGASCPASGSGNINATVDIPAGGTVTFTVTGTVSPGASGNLVNTATITPPAGITDPVPGNNSATDTDTAAPIADLSITKTDGSATYTPGGAISYTIVAGNAGPSDAVGAIVTDTLPATITGASWTCAGAGGATCPGGGSGNINATVNIPVGGTVTFTVTGTVSPGASGNLVNTAAIAPPSGTTDPNGGNDSATDTDSAAPIANLGIGKTDGSATYIAGSPITYTIVASNAGPANAIGASVVDAIPPSIVNPTWTCTGAGGASCPASGAGSINASVTIPVGGTATFVVTGTVSASASGDLVNTATIAVPSGMSDPVPGNNSATDTDTAAGSPFVCDVSTIFVSQGSPTQLNAATYGPGGTATFHPIGPVSNWIYNAAAYRAADRFIYAISQVTNGPNPIGRLLRIDPTTGIPVNLGAITGPLLTSGANIGTFDASDNYWIATSTGTAIYRLDLTTRVATPVNLVPSQAINVSDFTYADGFLWGVTNSAQTLVRINPATGATSQFPVPFIPAGTYGAIWTFGNGNLGLSNNVSGVIYQIAVSNPSGTPTLTLVSSSPGPSSSTNDGTACVAAPVDLGIVKTGPATAAPGGALSWSLLVTNHGPGMSSGFTVSDVVPAGVTGVASPTPGCSVAGNTVTCVGGVLASGDTFTITITGNAPSPFTAALTNTATVTGNEQDPDPANDTADATVAPQPPQLTVSKTATPNPFVVGQPGSYAITVQNAGTGPTTAPITIADTLPSGVTFVSATGAGWSCTGAPALNCTFAGTLAAGASTTLTIDVTVNAGATSADNSATASGGGDPGCPADGRCTGTVAVPVASIADLAITKTDGSAIYTPGNPITYTIVASNAGPSTAVGATVVDTIPPSITGATWTAAYSAGASGPAGGSGDIAATVTIPAGGTATFTVTGTVGTGTTGPLSNTATVTPPSGTTDPVPGNDSATDTDAQAPQLTVTKTASPNPFVPGVPGTYVITVQNTGGSATSAPITIADTLPAGITLTSATGANWSCSGTTALSCTFSGTLAVGASATLTLNVAVAASATRGDNTATASGGGDPTCPAAAHCVGSVIVPVSPTADIGLTKTVDDATPNVGDLVTFTVTVTNHGPNDATGVEVTDAFPSGLAFVSASPSQGAYDGGTGLWSIGALANGDSATLHITATVLATGTLTNTVTRTGGDQVDPDPSNNSASASVNGQPSADLGVQKTVDDATPNVGSDVTFTVTVTNYGPNDATGVVLDDLLPAGLTLVSATPSAGGYDGPSGIWTIGALANAASATLTITATVTQTGDITNIATVAASDQFDPNTGNDSAGATINGQSADLQVVKTVDEPNPTVGDTITFTITTTNNGPSAATGVAVTETLPGELTLVSATPSQGTYDSGTGLWAIGSLAATGPGATATLTVVATVNTAGAFTNVATVTGSDQPDPNPSNNSDDVPILGAASADLSVVKAGPASAVPGTDVTYTIQVTNSGPSTATAVSLDDPTPAGLAFVSATAPCGSGFPCVLGDLAAGATVTVTVTFSVPPNYAGATLVNTATVDSPTGDPDPSDNSSTVTTPVAPSANLAAVKTGPATIAAGGAISYTVVVANNGPSDANGAAFSDPVPAGITGVTATCGSPTGGAVCGTVNVAGNAVTSTITALPAGGSVAFTISGTAPADAATLTNMATVTPPTGVIDPDPSDNDDTVDTDVGAVADLSVLKTGPASATPGTNVAYTIQVSNAGPSTATAVSLSDPTPLGLTFVSATAPCAGGFPCALGDLPAGATVTVTVTFSVPPNYAGASIVNTATVGSSISDPDPSNNSSTVTTPVATVADLAISKTDGSATYTPGGTITYTVVASNAGPSDVSGAVVSDALPVAVSGVSWTASYAGGATGPAGGAGDLSATVDIPVGGTATFTITGIVSPSASGDLVNTATIAPPAGVTDPNPADDSATDTDTAAPSADLSAVKTGPATVGAGGAISYTVVVTNGGPGDANGALFSDAVPAGITGLTASCGSPTGGAVCGAVNLAGNTVSGAITTFPAGATVTFTISGTAPNDATTLTNTATIAPPAGTTDPDPSDNSSSVDTEVTPQADVSIVKTGPATATSGAAISYTLLISNAGPSAADGASYSDAVPAGITGVSASCGSPTGGAACAAPNVAGNTVSGTLPTLPAGSSVTITISGTAPFGAQSLTNTATVTPPSGTPDPDPSDNSSSVETTIGGAADIAVTKTVDNATPNVGDMVTFTIVASNLGPNDASGVALTDSLPFGLGFVSAAPSQGSFDSASGLWTIGNLAAGASVTLTITASVDQPGSLINTVAVSASDQPDPDTSNNNAAAAVNAGASADIGIAKTVDDATPNVGTQVTYTLTATNHGPNDATGIEVTDHLPAGVSFVSASPSQGTYASGSGVWAIGALADGASATLTIIVSVDQPGSIMNTATITHEDQFDPNPANNSAGVAINGQSADLAVTKTVDDAAPNVGGQVTFTITIHNSGPSDATGVVLTDQLPAALSFVSATPSQGSYDPASGLWSIGTLTAAGPTSTATLTITATVVVAGATTNTATVTGADQPDPNPANNSDSASLNGNPLADLAVTKSGPATVTPGNDVVYTIVVTNQGPSEASNVVVADATPAGLVFVSNAGACTTAYPCSIGTLANGASATITTTYSVPADYSGANPIVNTATASSDTPDPDPTDNQGSAQTGVGPGNADLTIVKTGPASVASNGAIHYTLLITNNGPSPANGASYSDAVPAGITGITASCGGELGGAACMTQPTVTGNTVAGTVGTLPSSGSMLITIDGTAPQGPLTLSNTATVTPPAGVNDPDPSDNEDDVDTAVGTPMADLAVQKTGPAGATPGAEVTYTLTVTNNGPDDAINATLDDPTPPGLSFVSATAPCAGGFPCDLGTLADGASASITVTFAVDADATGDIVNTADAGSDTPDPDPSNNQDSVTTPLSPQADLAAVKTGPATVGAGGAISYTVLVTNAGPSAADGALFSDSVPAGITGVTATCASPTGGAVCGAVDVVGNAVTSTIATLPAGGSVSFAIAGIAPASATQLTNTAGVEPPPGTVDPDPSDNRDSVDTDVVETPTAADLAVVKTGPANVAAGSDAVYTIVVTNHGPDAAANVVVSDPTPSGLVFVSNAGACTTAYPCAIGALASGASATITTTYAVPAAYAGPNPIANTASAGSDTPDPNASNNSDTATTPLAGTPAADLVVTKTGPASATAGQTISYQIQVVNHGPDAVPDAVLADPTPAGLEYVSSTAPCAGGFPCALPALANGASVTLTVTYAVQPGYGGTITNVAGAQSPTVPDPAPENNTGTASTPIIGAPGPVQPVPVDARWMLLMMGVLLMLAGVPYLRRRR